MLTEPLCREGPIGHERRSLTTTHTRPLPTAKQINKIFFAPHFTWAIFMSHFSAILLFLRSQGFESASQIHKSLEWYPIKASYPQEMPLCSPNTHQNGHASQPGVHLVGVRVAITTATANPHSFGSILYLYFAIQVKHYVDFKTKYKKGRSCRGMLWASPQCLRDTQSLSIGVWMCAVHLGSTWGKTLKW